jgi:hypothetical protein
MLLLSLLSLVTYVSATAVDHGITAIPTPTAIAKRQAASLTATVTLSSSLGTPSHLASGFIYGIPDTANQIADSFYTQMVSEHLSWHTTLLQPIHLGRDSILPAPEEPRLLRLGGAGSGVRYSILICSCD